MVQCPTLRGRVTEAASTSTADRAARRPRSPRNVWAGTVGALDTAGQQVRVHITGPVPLVAEVTPAAVAALRLGEGDAVFVSVTATGIDVHPA